MRYAALLAVAALALPLPASAQEGVDWGGLMAGIAHGTAMDEAAQESVTTNKRERAKPAPAPTTAQLTYTPSIERRRANFARFIEKSRARDPEGAATLEKALAAADPIETMASALTPYGMRVDSVGDAYAIWWLNAWLAAHRRTDTPPARQIAAVRGQAAQAMASLPEVAVADDAVKQEMAEAHLLHAALIGAYLEQAKNDPAKLSAIAASVRQGASASGLTLDTMELTDAGFVPGGTQAAAAREAGGSNTLVYAAVAAAVAGLLGGVWLGRRRKPDPARRG